jgi:membrane protein YqaA with SNARE-associated domain
MLALFNWRCGLRAVVWSVLGALLGGALVYGAGARLEREQSARLLDAIPAISPAMIERVEGEMRERGPASMLLGPTQGTPYKIYARTAGLQGLSLGETLLWTIPARGARFLLIAVIASVYGSLVRRRTQRAGWLLAPYELAWGAFYAWYFRRYGF